MMARVISTRLENITVRSKFTALIFKETLGQKCRMLQTGVAGTPKAALRDTGHVGRRKPRANFNISLCLWHLRDTQSPSDASGVLWGEACTDEEQQQRGLSTMKYPGQLPRRGQGPREQLPTATGAGGGAATPGPGPATSSGDHGGDIRCLLGPHTLGACPAATTVGTGKWRQLPWVDPRMALAM